MIFFSFCFGSAWSDDVFVLCVLNSCLDDEAHHPYDRKRNTNTFARGPLRQWNNVHKNPQSLSHCGNNPFSPTPIFCTAAVGPRCSPLPPSHLKLPPFDFKQEVKLLFFFLLRKAREASSCSFLPQTDSFSLLLSILRNATISTALKLIY